MSFPKHDAYQESGIPWLGQIPTHWEVGQSRRLFALRNQRAFSEDEQLTASQKHGVIPQQLFMELEGQKVVQVLLNAEILKHVEPGDFVISMRSFQGGIEYATYRGCISSAYVMLIPSAKVHGPFFKYLFKSQTYIQALQSTTNLVRDGQALRYQNFAMVDLPVVPMEEQIAIAAFLDRETAKIDALIAEQQRLIELLKEKRQAVISHAVTKGLNPGVPMKPSGIEWLGDVPEQWELKPLKYTGSVISGFAFKSQEFVDSGVRVLKIANVQTFTLDWTDETFLPESYYDEHSAFAVVDGDVVFALTRPIISTGLKAAIASIGVERVLLNQRNAIFRPNSQVNKRFLYYALFSNFFRIEFENRIDFTGQQPNISPLDIQTIRIPFPPLIEQERIAERLDCETTAIAKLVREAERSIELLQEHRAALISAAVTGKIDVRELACQESP